MRIVFCSIGCLFFLVQGCDVFLYEAGGEGERCFKNGKCDPGLVCVDNVCQKATDPCDPDPCNGHGTCSGGTCTCNTGYAGDHCDQCAAGYVGYPNCTDDPCDPDPCNGHGTCSGGTCTCDTGWAGAACDSCAAGYIGYPNCTDDPCDPDPCNGHGTCAGGTCTCNTGYAGTVCDTCAAGYIGYPNCVDETCDPDPCNGHGTCSAGACTCNIGYAGAACDGCDAAYTAYPDCDQCAAGAFGEYPYCFLPDGDYCLTSQCFFVPPTNQTQCFDNANPMDCTDFPCKSDGTPDFCGQDAQYPDNVRVFTCYDASGNVQNPCDASAEEGEVVTDSLTGLMWQRTFTSELTWQGAIDYCNNLVYAGHDDWRLPNPFELESIVNDRRSGPSIDTVVFPGTPSANFWSSSSFDYNTGNAWFVSFANGYVAHDDKNIAYYARCVRPGPISSNGSGAPFFVSEPVAGEQVVYDAVTGLLWQKSYATRKTWRQALSYCEGLDYAGHGDWRLPDKNELMSLVNYSRYNPASDFPDMPSYWFWSSSSYANNTFDAWLVNFAYGLVNNKDKNFTYNARCVRPGP